MIAKRGEVGERIRFVPELQIGQFRVLYVLGDGERTAHRGDHSVHDVQDSVIRPDVRLKDGRAMMVIT